MQLKVSPDSAGDLISISYKPNEREVTLYMAGVHLGDVLTLSPHLLLVVGYAGLVGVAAPERDNENVPSLLTTHWNSPSRL